MSKAKSRLIPKQYKPLVEAALANGWRLKPCTRHNSLLSPDGSTIVTVPCTPSEYRGWANTRAELRRAGVRV